MSMGQPPGQDPYRSPLVPPQQGGAPGRCPKCGGTHNAPPTFTWWGGLIGHKVLSHVVCSQCGTGFNRKTGQSNNINIAIYMIVMTVIFVPVLFVLFWIMQM